ncbi:hypothetical protein [Caulobacter sp. LARHSG274]
MSKLRSWGAVLGAATGVLSAGEPVLAQADLRLLREQNQILQQQDIARQNALAAQREAAAARGRYEAQQALRPLDAAPRTTPEPQLRPSQPVPPRGPADPGYSALNERLDRQVDERLAESNARLRAITPAR